jgi:hypothetical protein
MENALLVLCPDEPRWTLPENHSLEEFLQSIQLIGAPLDGDRKFLAGDRFLELIALLGCSPGIRLEPGEDKLPFSYVRLLPRTDAIEFHSSTHTHAPRCPQCRSPVTDWKSEISNWQQHGTEIPWTCTACGLTAEPWQYNWRKSAGFGRCFIEISNIFPKEAIPQQQLLDALHSHYSVSWHYFYQY